MDKWMPVPPEECALPVYAKVVYRLTEDSPGPDCEPGRIIVNSHWEGWVDHNEGVGARLHPDLPDLLGPNDVVYVSLYQGTCERAGEGTRQRAAHFDYNVTQMARFAPKVKAILVGNAGSELSFKHAWWRDPRRGPQYASEKAAEFVRQTAAIIRDVGGRPAYGTMDWDLGLDCYQGGRLIREAIIAAGALQWCVCGWKLLTGEMNAGYYHQATPPEGPRPENRFTDEDMPILRQYLRGTETIGGVGHWQGLRNGNDARVLKAGFSAGSLGVA